MDRAPGSCLQEVGFCSDECLQTVSPPPPAQPSVSVPSNPYLALNSLPPVLSLLPRLSPSFPSAFSASPPSPFFLPPFILFPFSSFYLSFFLSLSSFSSLLFIPLPFFSYPSFLLSLALFSMSFLFCWDLAEGAMQSIKTYSFKTLGWNPKVLLTHPWGSGSHSLWQ